ncbi:MAG: hypothetical protein NTW21_09895 [Verrucomicrobia bacterium]|nr:hypothetical protein [Verrucomicrobiota bacterium]
MKPTALFSLWCLCFAGTSLAPVAAMSLEAAGVALGNEVFKVREDAEQVIRMAGLDEYDQVGHFARSNNPEVAARARRSLPIILLGIDARFPPDLASKLRRIDDFRGPELEQIVSGLVSLEPPRPVTLLGLHSHWQARRPDSIDASQKLIASLEQALLSALRGDAVVGELSQLHPERYETDTLAMILDGLCKLRPDDLAPVLPLHESWTRSRPQLLDRLNADGYRLELAKEASGVPNRREGLRIILNLATKRDLSRDQQAAVRKQLASYRDEAGTFPVETLDQDTAWYFFDVFGPDQGGQTHLEAYRKFRTRFPELAAASLLAQPLEVLLVLDKSGPGAALDYAMKQSVHGGVMVLAEWLHAHPELIREPLPLPPVKDGEAYKYRTIKFFRVFAPYPDEAALRQHPAIAAAVEVLAKDPRWNEVAKQARAVMTQQQQEAPPQAR